MEQKIKIIFADDHALARELMKIALQDNEKISIIQTCDNTNEAIAASIQNKPDILLLDIGIGPINGIEATAIMKEKVPDVKVIGYSIKEQPFYAKQMMKMGAKGFVTKTSSVAEIENAITTVFEGKEYLCKETLDYML